MANHHLGFLLITDSPNLRKRKRNGRKGKEIGKGKGGRFYGTGLLLILCESYKFFIIPYSKKHISVAYPSVLPTERGKGEVLQ